MVFYYSGTFPSMKALQLRSIRGTRGLSLRALKAASGVAVSALAKMEGGKGDPQLSTLRKLSKALRCSIAELVGEAPFRKEWARTNRLDHPDIAEGAAAIAPPGWRYAHPRAGFSQGRRETEPHLIGRFSGSARSKASKTSCSTIPDIAPSPIGGRRSRYRNHHEDCGTFLGGNVPRLPS